MNLIYQDSYILLMKLVTTIGFDYRLPGKWLAYTTTNYSINIQSIVFLWLNYWSTIHDYLYSSI